MIERDVIGGAAHLWDCIPSKAMIATGGAMSFSRRHRGHGPGRAARRRSTSTCAARPASPRSASTLAGPAPTNLPHRPGRAAAARRGPVQGAPRDRHRDRPAAVEELEADAVLVATGSGPASRSGRSVDGEPGAHHPRRLPAAGAAVAPGGDRLGRHRRGVRPHVLVARLRGHPDRVPPAGAADQGPRGRRRAGGRVPAAGRAPLQGGPGHRDRPRRGRGRLDVDRALRRRPVGHRLAHPAGHRLDPQQRRARPGRRRGRRSTAAATSRSSTTAVTNVEHIYAAGDVSGEAAAVVGGVDGRAARSPST